MSDTRKMKLYGRTALVTGRSRGIGRASALVLAAAGCNVAVNYLHAHDEAEPLRHEIVSRGQRTVARQADVSREADVQQLVRTVEQDLGPIDILVNSAGINSGKPLAELTLADWHATIATNLTSSFLVSRAVLPGMRQRQWGRLIFLPTLLPVGRFGTAEEVAEAVPLLATNSDITGQTINLNGGWYMS
jgi:3-oxoacyl-[acyl-carrier protein] reductase